MLFDHVQATGHLRVDKYTATGKLFETVDAHNIFLTVGINELWALIIGQSANTFNNAHATIGIGDSALASNANQADLQSTSNKTYKSMTASYPLISAGSVQFQALFDTADANYVWNEFVIRHSTSLICIDRGVQALGTKAAGTKWTATVTLSIS